MSNLTDIWPITISHVRHATSDYNYGFQHYRTVKNSVNNLSENSRVYRENHVHGVLDFLARKGDGIIARYQEEHEPLVLYDDDESGWVRYGYEGSTPPKNLSYYATTISAFNVTGAGEVIKGTSSVGMSIPAGSSSSRMIARQTFTDSLVRREILTIQLWGRNDSGLIRFALTGGPSGARFAKEWDVRDDFTGWKKHSFDINTPDRFRGPPFNPADLRWMEVSFNTSGMRYFDRITADTKPYNRVYYARSG